MCDSHQVYAISTQSSEITVSLTTQVASGPVQGSCNRVQPAIVLVGWLLYKSYAVAPVACSGMWLQVPTSDQVVDSVHVACKHHINTALAVVVISAPGPSPAV